MLEHFEPNRPERFNLALIPYVTFPNYLRVTMREWVNFFLFVVTIYLNKLNMSVSYGNSWNKTTQFDSIKFQTCKNHCWKCIDYLEEAFYKHESKHISINHCIPSAIDIIYLLYWENALINRFSFYSTLYILTIG